jgi:hypothetical protein
MFRRTERKERKRVKKNSTNRHLYASANSENKPTETNKSEVEDKDLLRKLKLIEKAFK